ncbi:MAG: hypothetical protein ACI4AH_01505 [Muribaculaceae bacterium]
MDDSLQTLLKQVLELEGLLLIADKRGDDVPDMVVDMIVQKAAAIGEMANLVGKTPTPETIDYNKQIIDSLPDDEPDDDIELELIEEPEPQDTESEPVIIPAPEPEPTPEPVIIPAPEPETTPEPVIIPAPKPANEIAEPEILADKYAQPEQDDTTDSPLTLDEAFQRDMTKDLRQAFSLNDRYRYRRELFGNSDSVMNETLNLIETMHSFDEAEDYFYNDLQWEHDSPEVADFMVIIKNHFWNKRPQV